MLKKVNRITRGKCNICNSDRGLVYSSIMYGSICNKCMQERFNRDSQGKTHLKGMETMPEFEFEALFKSPLAKGIATALMDIYGRYQAILTEALVYPEGNIVIRLSSKYRGKDCIITLWTTKTNTYPTVVYNIVDRVSKHEIIQRVFRIKENEVYLDVKEE